MFFMSKFTRSVLYVKENHVCSSLSTVSYECLVCKGEPWLFCMSNMLLGMSCMQRRTMAVLHERHIAGSIWYVKESHAVRHDQQFARSVLYVKENHGHSS